jgi:hypothetical protein
MLGSQNAGGNLFNSMMGNQNQYALGLGNLSNQMASTQSDIFNRGFGNELANGQLNLGYNQFGNQRGSDISGAMNQAFGNWNNSQANNSGLFTNLANQYGTQAGRGMDLASNYIRNYPSAINAMVTPGNQQGNPFTAIGSTFTNLGSLKKP